MVWGYRVSGRTPSGKASQVEVGEHLSYRPRSPGRRERGMMRVTGRGGGGGRRKEGKVSLDSLHSRFSTCVYLYTIIYSRT